MHSKICSKFFLVTIFFLIFKINANPSINIIMSENIGQRRYNFPWIMGCLILFFLILVLGLSGSDVF